MRRFLILALMASVLTPAFAQAQSSNSGSTSVNDYGQGFFGGGGEEEEEKEGPGIWQYDKKLRSPSALGHGAFLSQKEVTQNGKTGKQTTYNVVSQYDPVLRKVLSGNAGQELDKNGKPVKEIRLLPNGEQYIYFVRTPNAKNNEATLRMVTPVSINGCVKMAAPHVTVRKSGGRLAFTVEDGAVGIDKTVRYAHYQCHQGSNVASADVTLNRDELVENNIKTVTFQTGGGAMDTYNVELTDNKLTLLPKTSFAFKPFMGSTRADPLSYDFYPDNLVILYAPGAGKKDDLSEQIQQLAGTKGLMPAGDETPGHFIDQQGTFASSLAFDANAFVGTITTTEKYQGANGAYDQDKQIDVYAKRPSTLD